MMFGLTTRVSDRHLTEEVGMHCGDQGIKKAWQTRWLVAVHLDSMVRPSDAPAYRESACNAHNDSAKALSAMGTLKAR